jgi:hypothetical protein
VSRVAWRLFTHCDKNWPVSEGEGMGCMLWQRLTLALPHQALLSLEESTNNDRDHLPASNTKPFKEQELWLCLTSNVWVVAECDMDWAVCSLIDKTPRPPPAPPSHAAMSVAGVPPEPAVRMTSGRC